MFYPDEDEDEDECFQIAKLNEPILVISPAVYEGTENFLKNATFSVKLKLFWAYTNFQDFTYQELEDAYEDILQTICNMSNWTNKGAEVSAPYDVQPFEKKGEHKATPRVLMAEAKIFFKSTALRI
jgi:hypothetical protein